MLLNVLNLTFCLEVWCVVKAFRVTRYKPLPKVLPGLCVVPTTTWLKTKTTLEVYVEQAPKDEAPI
jgi:hypothetical protein